MKRKDKRIFTGSLLILCLIYTITLIGKTCSSSPKKKELNKDSITLMKKYQTTEFTSNKKLADAISADAAIIMNPVDGKIIFKKNADRLEYPASMTKMMTCILAIESGKLNNIVTISGTASIASDTYLAKGDRIKLGDMLYLLMLPSNNGCAVAIAEYLSTNQESFIQKMNRKAKELGMNNTHFVTPNGMHDPNHYSTAYDMAKLAAYCMRNTTFREVVKTETKRIIWKFRPGKNFLCRNENKLLHLYDGVNGIKTGFTDTALGCLATSYDKNGIRLIVIVMHSRKGQLRLHDSMKLLDWAKTQHC